MITARGFWLLLTLFAVFVLAVLLRQTILLLVALSALVWFASEWVLFLLRVEWTLAHAVIDRQLEGRPASRATIWCDRWTEVVLRVRTESHLGIPFVEASDREPTMGHTTEIAHRPDGWDANRPIRVRYGLRLSSPGRVRFEGVLLYLFDHQRFFAQKRFLHEPMEATVLPPLSGDRGGPSATKRFNQLPIRGVHRHRRPGTGSELLDLRDYVPGDPPKCIAWKVSARRDRLITKEYESEVPVRCTLFVDASDSVRIGPPGRNLLSSAVRIVLAVAERCIVNRDPIGMCLFDERGGRVYRPASGDRHLYTLAGAIARTAAQPVQPSQCPPDRLILPAHEFARDVYPELMDQSVNRPAPWFSRLPFLTSLRGLTLLVVVLAGLVSIYLVINLNVSFLIKAAACFLVIATSFLIFRGFMHRRRRAGYRTPWRLRTKRKQLASLFAVREGLGPGGIPLLEEDNDAFSAAAQRFLNEHRVPYRRPYYGTHGKYLFSSPSKLEWLRKYLLRAVAMAHDNELFVIVVDLLELPADWKPVIQAIKVALSRHHQVILICPWPVGLPAPDEDEEIMPAHAARTADRYAQDPVRAIRRLDMVRYRRAHAELRELLSPLGVPLVLGSGSQAVGAVLARIERLRSAQIPSHH
ncbi:hypothetical protein Pan216_06660 [Planctomycetes bacterium Pan216]|uniref:DUF58 domain-containing protein n=1 Tax=Kolteria novifilia TaxID=2527975 RepID=A0A518AYN7_9BACT|nr:hypothetical protein Pan216_06660 [Planctomycetes bacterium Pan216]